jgi:hypothetical protein
MTYEIAGVIMIGFKSHFEHRVLTFGWLCNHLLIMIS